MDRTIPPASRRRTSRSASIPLPREHGAWGILLTSFVVGTLSAAHWSWTIPLLLVASLGGFVLRETLFRVSAQGWAGADPQTRRWLLLSAALAVGLSAVLVVGFGLLGLVAFVMVAGLAISIDLTLRHKRQSRSTAGELMGVTQLTLLAPAAFYTALGGSLDPAQYRSAAVLWILLVAYYAGSIPFVKLKLRQLVEQPSTLRARLSLAAPTLAYQVALLVAVVAAVSQNWLPWPIIAGYVPNAYKTFRGAVSVPPRVSFRKVGWTEVAYAGWFAVVIVAVFR